MGGSDPLTLVERIEILEAENKTLLEENQRLVAIENDRAELHAIINRLKSACDKYRSESEYYCRKYTESLRQTAVQKAAAQSYDDNHPGWDVS